MKAVVAQQVRAAFIAASRPMRLFAGVGGCPVRTKHGPFNRKSRLAPDGFPDRVSVDPQHPLADAATEWLANGPRLARRAAERGTLVFSVPPINIETPSVVDAEWWAARATAWRQSVEAWGRLGSANMQENCRKMAEWCQTLADGKEIACPDLRWEAK